MSKVMGDVEAYSHSLETTSLAHLDLVLLKLAVHHDGGLLRDGLLDGVSDGVVVLLTGDVLVLVILHLGLLEHLPGVGGTLFRLVGFLDCLWKGEKVKTEVVW